MVAEKGFQVLLKIIVRFLYRIFGNFYMEGEM
jgi:hypothetical protein